MSLRKQLAERWAGTSCVLNDRPARVIGRLRNFAIVASDDNELRLEYAWETVDRIMKRDGRFEA